MKTTLVTLLCAAAFLYPSQLAAQHARYKLIDIGTLGGPVSYDSLDGIAGRIPTRKVVTVETQYQTAS